MATVQIWSNLMKWEVFLVAAEQMWVIDMHVIVCIYEFDVVGSSSQANCLLRNSAMDDSIGGS